MVPGVQSKSYGKALMALLKVTISFLVHCTDSSYFAISSGDILVFACVCPCTGCERQEGHEDCEDCEPRPDQDRPLPSPAFFVLGFSQHLWHHVCVLQFTLMQLAHVHVIALGTVLP